MEEYASIPKAHLACIVWWLAKTVAGRVHLPWHLHQCSLPTSGLLSRR